jgi:hypothetical protein
LAGKLVLTLALIPAFSPGEKESALPFSDSRMIVRLIPSPDIPKTRCSFLPLMEERAGVRTVVITNIVDTLTRYPA